MVSEDSRRLGRLLEVHRRGDLRNLYKARHGEVSAKIHQTNHFRELDEVISLRSSERVLLEERNDHIPQVSKLRDVVAGEILTMVVAPTVDR